MALTVGTDVSQWPEMIRMELGLFGYTFCFHDWRNFLAGIDSSMLSVGDPWDM